MRCASRAYVRAVRRGAREVSSPILIRRPKSSLSRPGATSHDRPYDTGVDSEVLNGPVRRRGWSSFGQVAVAKARKARRRRFAPTPDGSEKLRSVTTHGKTFHRNRTQEVAGSSPASSILKRPAKPDLFLCVNPLVPRFSKRWGDLYRGRAAVEREFGRLKNEYGLTPLRVRGIERVALHADLTMLARLSLALARARAVPLAA
jgi:hypothetical protein